MMAGSRRAPLGFLLTVLVALHGAEAQEPAEQSVSATNAALLEAAVTERHRSPRAARRLGAELRLRLRDAPDPAIEAATYLNDCWTQFEESGQKGVDAARRGLKVLEKLPAPGDPVLAARLELCELGAREYLGELSNSMSGYDRLLERARIIGDERLRAEIRVARGELRAYSGRYAEGLEDLQAACKLYRKLEARYESLYCQQAIAVVYYRVHDYDRAIEYLNEVIPEFEKDQLTHRLSDALFNLARTLDGKGDAVGAQHNYERMAQLSRELGNSTGEAYADQAIGALLIRQDQPARALPKLDAALKVFREVLDGDMTARVLQTRAQGLYQLARDREAIAALDEAVQLYLGLDQQIGLEKSYRLLATVLLRTGDAERAARTMLLEREVHERLDRARRDESLAEQRAQFDTEKKEQANRYLKARNELAATALQDAERIDGLKTAVLVLSALLLMLVVAFLVRQMRLSRRLSALALSDELTGIGNRRSVLTFLEEQIRLHRASGKPLSVVLLDIDKFKLLNDQYGHAAGDEALKAIAALCQQLMRGNDKIGRTGGEEFLAVLPGAPLTDAGDVALRLCEQVRELPLDQIETGLRTSVSIGVSQWHPGDGDAQEVVKRADAALYRAKDAGRNRVEIALD